MKSLLLSFLLLLLTQSLYSEEEIEIFFYETTYHFNLKDFNMDCENNLFFGLKNAGFNMITNWIDYESENVIILEVQDKYLLGRYPLIFRDCDGKEYLFIFNYVPRSILGVVSISNEDEYVLHANQTKSLKFQLYNNNEMETFGIKNLYLSNYEDMFEINFKPKELLVLQSKETYNFEVFFKGADETFINSLNKKTLETFFIIEFDEGKKGYDLKFSLKFDEGASVSETRNDVQVFDYSDHFLIKFKDNSLSNARIDVVDYLGTRVNSFEVNKNEMTLTKSQFNKGVYFLVFEINGTTIIEKIII